MTQQEQNWPMKNTRQLEDKISKNIKLRKEAITRQKQLICQLTEEINQLLEETQRGKNEIDYMRKKTEWQQEHIGILTAEKHKQYLLIKRLRLQLENVMEKLEENKNEATREKMELQKMCAEISQEMETLDKKCIEIMNERCKFEMIKNKKTKLQAPGEPIEQIKQGQESLMADSLLSLINKNNKTMLETKQAKKQIDQVLADLKQELQKNKTDITKHRNQIEHIKHNMNINFNKMKQRWTKIQGDVQIQKVTVSETEREGQKGGKATFDTVKIKLSRIQEEMEKLWDVLDNSDQQLDVTLRDKQELKTETGQLENMKPEFQMEKQDMEKKLSQVQYEKDEIERIKAKINTERENIERDRLLAKAEKEAIMCMRESIKQQKQELDDQLQVTKKEMREMEVLNTEIEMKKNDLVKMIRMSRRQKKEMTMVKDGEQDMEERQKNEGQKSEEVEELSLETRFDEQVDRTREIMQHRDHQFKEDNDETSIKEKSHLKWMKFQAKKRPVLDQQLQRTMKERDELEMVKIKIQQQREEAEKKLEDIMTTTLTMGVMKANIEKAAAEIDNTREEMLKAQRKVKENKEEVKKHMDKLTSMKAQISKWMEKKIFSVNASNLQQPQKETQRQSLKVQAFEILTEKEETEDEITKEVLPSQQSVRYKRRRNGEIKKEEQELNLFAVDIKEKDNVFLQMQTDIQEEETLMDDDETEPAINVKGKAEMERQLCILKDNEEKIREQIMYAMKNMEEKNQEIKKFIMEINYLPRQRSETGLQNTVRESGNVEEQVTRLLKKTNDTEILRVNTNVSKHEIIKYKVHVQKKENVSQMKQDVTDESDLMRFDVDKQKQSQESREHLKTHTGEMDGYSPNNDTQRADIQRLRTEIYRTQEIISSMKLELETQAEERNINKDPKDEGSETKRLLKDIEQFQDLLKMVKTVMRQRKLNLKEEMSNMKFMKNAAKKQKRELDQRLEKTLRERDELDILKMKMQRHAKVNFEKMTKVKNAMEKMAAKTKKKNEDIEMIIKETKVKLRRLEHLNCKIEATNQELENRYVLICKERADLENFKTEIRQENYRKSAFESDERENQNIKKHIVAETDTVMDRMVKNRVSKEMEDIENKTVRPGSENKKLQGHVKLKIDCLDQKDSEVEPLNKAMSELVKQNTERQETDMLKQQIEVEWENVRIPRQHTEAEKHEMNHLGERIKRQKSEIDDRMHADKRKMRKMELLKSELKTKKKESERTFRKIMRRKEESAITWNEIQREKRLIRRRRRELDQQLEKTMRERDELEVLRIKHQHETGLADEKQSIKDKTTLIPGYTEHERQRLEKQEMMSKLSGSVTDIQNMRQKIHVHLEVIKGETGILENVNAHLRKQTEDLKALKAENRSVRDNMSRAKFQIKTAIEAIALQAKTQRDEIVQMWGDFQQQKQELENKLENIKKERREIEILKTELETTKRENEQLVQKDIRKEREVKNMWAEVKKEKAALKRETQKRSKELEQRLERLNRERDEVEIMKLKLQREKDERKSDTKKSGISAITKVTQKNQKHMELYETLMGKYDLMIKHSENLKGEIKDKKRYMATQAKLTNQIETEIENIKVDIKRQKENMKYALKNIKTYLEQVEQVKKSREIEKEIERNREKSEELLLSEKELRNGREFVKAEAVMVKTEQEKEKEECKEIKMDVKYEKEQKEEKDTKSISGVNDKISDDAKKTHVLGLNESLHKDIEEKEDTETEIQLHEKLERIPKTEQFQRKGKLELRLKGSDNKNLNQQKDRDQKDLKGIKFDIQKEIRQLEDNKSEGKGKDTLQIKQTENVKKEQETYEIIKKKTVNTELLDTEILKMSDVVSEDVKDQWTNFDQQSAHLEKLKAEQEQEQANLEKVNEMVKREKLDLEMKKSDIQKQVERVEQFIKQEIKNLEITKVEAQKMKSHSDNLFDEINREKIDIDDLSLQVLTERDKVQSTISIITLKRQEQELKEEELKRLEEELEISRNHVLSQREKNELLRQDLNNRKEEVEAAMISNTEEREQLIRMRTDNDKAKEILLKEKHKMEEKGSELKLKEDQLALKMESVEALRVKLQRVNERMHKDMNDKMDSLQQYSEDVLMLHNVSQKAFIELDQKKENLTRYTLLLEKEKEALKEVLSDMVIRRQSMENQWKQKLELEKEDQLALKMESVEALRVKLQGVNDKMHEDMKNKMDSLDQTNEDVLRLCTLSKQALVEQGEQRETLTCYTLLLEKEKEALKEVLSDMVIRRQSMENQWKQKLELEKEDVEKLKAELKQEREDQDRVNEMVKREKLDLEMKKSDIQKQVERVEQFIKQEIKNLEITKVEAQKMKSHSDNLFDEINREKIDIDDLSLQVLTERDKVQNTISIITLKRQEQELKEEELKRLEEELEISRNHVLSQREINELLRQDLNNRKEEVEAAMRSITEEREQLIRMRTDNDKAKEILLKEKHKMEEKGSELKLKEDQLALKMESVEALRVKLQGVNDKMHEDMKNKMDSLDQTNEDVLRLCTLSKQALVEQGEQRENLTRCTLLLEKEKEDLKEVLSDMVIRRQSMENQWKQKLELEKEDVEKLKAELKQEREDQDRVNEMMKREKLDLEMKKSDIQKQVERVEQFIKQEIKNLEITKVEAQKMKSHSDNLFDEINREKIDIDDLSLQVLTERDTVQNTISIITLKRQEQELKEEELKRLEEELEISRNHVLSQREKNELLKQDLNNRKEEVEAAMISNTEEREQLIRMRTDNDKAKEILLKEKHKMEEKGSELKVKEDQLALKMESVEALRVKLQRVNDKMHEDMKNKMDSLDQSNEEVLRLCTLSKQALVEQGEQRETLTRYTLLLEKEKEALKEVLSDMVIRRQSMENQWKQKLELEKEDVEKLKAELKQEREDRNRVNEKVKREKLNLELMRSDIQKQTERTEQVIKEERDKLEITKAEVQKNKEHVDNLIAEITRAKINTANVNLQVQIDKNKVENIINMFTLKRTEQELKEEELNRLKQELETCRNDVQSQREQLESFSQDLNNRKEEVEAAMRSITEEREQLVRMRTDNDKAKEILLKEKHKMEEKGSELKVKEDQLALKMESVEALRVKLQGVNDKMHEDMKNKMDSLDQTNEDVLRLCTLSKQALVEQGEQRETLTRYTLLLEKEKEDLKEVLSDMVIRRQRMENQWKQKLELEKEDVEKLKAELKQEREDQDRVNEMVKREKLDLEMKKSDIQKQVERVEQFIKQKIKNLEITKVEAQKMKSHSDNLFDEINREKIDIDDLSLQVLRNRDKVQNTISIITLKRQEQELKEEGLNRLKQELEICRNHVLSQREKIELLRQDLNNRKEEVEAAMISNTEEREQLIRMRTDNDKAKEILLKEKHKMEEKGSELKLKEDQLALKMESVEALRVKLQRVNERMHKDMNDKMDSLQQYSEDVLMLHNVSQKAFIELDQKKENLTRYTLLLEKEKEDLNEVLSDMVIQRQRMENQWKEKLELEKEDQLALKMESVEALRVKLQRVNERMHEDMKNKMDSLDQTNKDVLRLCTLSKQALVEQGELRENLTRYTLLLEKEKEDLKELLSDMVIRRQSMENQWKQKLELEKEDQLALKMKSVETLRVKLQQINERLHEDMKNKMDSLQQYSEDVLMLHNVSQKAFIEPDLWKQQLDLENQYFEKQVTEGLKRVNEVMNREKLNLALMMSDFPKEMTKAELQSKKQNTDCPVCEMKQDKEELYQMETSIDKSIEIELSELKFRVAHFTSIINSMKHFIGKLKQLNQRTRDEFQKNLHRLEQNKGNILQMNSVLKLKCDELVKQKKKITAYSDLIQKEKKHMLSKNLDKVVQTEVVAKGPLQEQDVKKEHLNKLEVSECKRDHLKSDVASQTEESEHQWNSGQCNIATLSDPASDQDYFTDKKMSKRDCLRNIWKDTKMERLEIDQMKRRGHEMRNILETRLKVINQFVKRTWLQKEKEPPEKTILEEQLSKKMISKSDSKRDSNKVNERYTELQQPKARMLSEIEKPQVNEKVSRTLTTSDKAVQTIQVDKTTGDATVQVTEQASTKMHYETEVAPETNSGILCHLRHYCYRCCCPCCDCWKQVCTEEK
uniref:golgin subfamily A member 4-like n=1 Tax=Scatophagus argus TaxID=75038 RepID=UPI001ED85C2D|nr:golgin subfamily A member 4-like [Scatophagus argus]